MKSGTPLFFDDFQLVHDEEYIVYRDRIKFAITARAARNLDLLSEIIKVPQELLVPILATEKVESPL
ncbi:hypothetical protein NDU88_009038 [Pleurodeles waltl]|uniref:Uncharacterized protein n=1 Tax=Pleurodeles waltl TaxID=8319 RepID=A0AAV7P220_PLEWA|nr:hypothetical protein NDU88_009038 [Pleurodeles waltl]